MPFKPGYSGNAQGRPKGSVNRNTKLRELLSPHKEGLVHKAISLALDGNEAMLKLLLDRLLPPKPKDEPVSGINITGENSRQDAIEIITQVASGDITPTEGNTLLNLVMNNMRLIESTELLERLQKLEENYEKNINVNR